MPLATVNVSVGNYSSWKEAVRPAWMAVKHFGGHGAILFLGLVGASSSPRCCAAGAPPEGSLATSQPCDAPQNVLVNCSTDTWLPRVPFGD